MATGDGAPSCRPAAHALMAPTCQVVTCSKWARSQRIAQMSLLARYASAMDRPVIGLPTVVGTSGRDPGPARRNKGDDRLPIPIAPESRCNLNYPIQLRTSALRC